MNSVFLFLFNHGISVSWLIIAVLAVRVLYKKSPTRLKRVLWTLVFLRLLIPVKIETPLSLIPSSETVPFDTESAGFDIYSGIPFIDKRVNASLASEYYEGVTVPANFKSDLVSVLGAVWLAGAVLILSYAVYSSLILRRKTRAKIPLGGGVYLSDNVPTAFVLGVFRPAVILPSNLTKREAELVILHEKTHIKHFDHITKPILFLILTVYWFNPLVWLSFVLFCRDIEVDCDESVVENAKEDIKKEYSEALLSCAQRSSMLSPCPLAFAENGVGTRIKKILSYKKPTAAALTVSVLILSACTIFFSTDPLGIRLSNIEKLSLSGTLASTEQIFITAENESLKISSDKDEFLEYLGELRISRGEISYSRSENRDSSYKITLRTDKDVIHGRDGSSFCFSGDFTKVWYDNSVKPTLTYRVLSPEKAEALVNSVLAQARD